MIYIALVVAGVVPLALLLWRGRATDRIVSATVLAGMVATMLLEGLVVGRIRIGVTLVDLLLLAVFMAAAINADRWWLLNLSSLHIISILTHLAPALGSDAALSTTATLRTTIWIAMTFTFAFGLIEIEAERRAALEGANDADEISGGDRRLA